MPVFVHCNGNKLSSIGGLRSVADPVGSEPFWSDPDAINCSDPDPINCPDPDPINCLDPDPINCPDPDLTIKSHKTRKKSNMLNRYFIFSHFYDR